MESDGPTSEKGAWTQGFPQGEPDRVSLARLVDHDQDEAEAAYYEAVADPTYVAVESARRRYRGMIRRKLRRRRDS
jgi:hypothetical protein